MDGFLDSRSAGWIRLRDVVRKSGDEMFYVVCFLLDLIARKRMKPKASSAHHTTGQSTRAMQAFGASCATEP